MRIGLFGGTFDPPHLGHLLVAEQAREQAALDFVWFVPAPRPPHKAGTSVTPFARRAEMLELATAGQPAFAVSRVEEHRTGPSYTVDTLTQLRAERPGDDWVLILGADCVPDLPKWHEPRTLVTLAELCVVDRPGTDPGTPEQLAAALGMPDAAAIRWRRITLPTVSISSRDVRARAAAGRSVRYLVPAAVEAYIRQHRVYG